ncbi:hypothetical protein [Ilumatobacter nonamiensis]|uniref:hypothetical protein n=1 Tax=Ilumatobacter nonamiensis TaxID=467093 RepID=UPI00139249AA|nr:hypothetical protein [Ilumatobacter nonamiensis]
MSTTPLLIRHLPPSAEDGAVDDDAIFDGFTDVVIVATWGDDSGPSGHQPPATHSRLEP